MKQTKECDGSVAGAVNSSGATVSSAIKTIGLEAGVSTLSSFFIMVRHFVLLLTVSYCFFVSYDCAKIDQFVLVFNVMTT